MRLQGKTTVKDPKAMTLMGLRVATVGSRTAAGERSRSARRGSAGQGGFQQELESARSGVGRAFP